MRTLQKDLKKGLIKVQIENPDDLWYLDQIVEPGDLCRHRTIRKLKIGDENNPKIVKKPVTLTINVETTEFHETTGNLRIAGKIVDGPDDIPRGNYHTFTLEPGKDLTIIKKVWPKYLLDKIKEAEQKPSDYLVVIFDREKAIFAELKRRKHNILSSINVDVQKKDAPTIKSNNIYKTIIKQVQEYLKRTEYTAVIAASANFWKSYLEKEIPDELKKKVVFANISTVNKSALNELIKRPELKTLLSKERLMQESNLMDKILEAISKEKAFYGIKEADEKVKEGNSKLLLVSNNFIIKTRQNNTFPTLNFIMRMADKNRIELHIISSEQAAKQLDNLGGIAGVCRW
jgi:protein pelota